MLETIKSIGDSSKDTINDVKEVLNERLFSPMYFYFLISWAITNWKFVYTLLFTSEELILTKTTLFKHDYLLTLYPLHSWLSLLWSVSKLIIIPIIATYIIVWWLSLISEKFYFKNEQHKVNKRTILNQILYTEKANISIWQRKIRDAESDKNEISYQDNKEFNKWFDEANENVKVGAYEFLPSEALYNTDYAAYKEELEGFKNIKPPLDLPV